MATQGRTRRSFINSCGEALTRLWARFLAGLSMPEQEFWTESPREFRERFIK